jgi:hypothetical protein
VAFGTFRLTGEFDKLGGPPACGDVIIEGIPSVILDPAGNKIEVGPVRVPLGPLGTFHIDLPSDVTTGQSVAIGYRVTTDLRNSANVVPTQFFARAIGSTLDLADVLTAVIEPVGDTTANRIAAQAAQAAAETAAAAAQAVGNSNDTIIASRINDHASATFAALKSWSTLVRVADYGTLGSDPVVNTATFQAALNAGAGKCVVAPPGTWLLNNINLSAGTWLMGAGQGATVLKAKNGLNADFITNTSGASDITISDLSVDGNKANQTPGATCRGIYMVLASRLLLTRLHIYDVEAHGIHLSNVGQAIEGQRVSDCVIERSGSGALNTFGSNFATTNGTSVTLTNVHSFDSAKAGFRLSGTFTLNGCVAKRNGNGGIVTVSGEMTGLTVNGGFYCDNGPGSNNDGIRLVGANTVELNGPVCIGNAGAGVGIYSGTANVVISGGIYKNNGQVGTAAATVEGRDGITIRGDSTTITDVIVSSVRAYDNQTPRTQQYGVKITGLVDFVTVTGSILRGNLTDSLNNGATGSPTNIVTASNVV